MKKIKVFYRFTVLSIGFMLFMHSCQREELTQISPETSFAENYYFNGDYFEFEKVEDFIALGKKVQSLNSDEFKKFEKEIGYQSIHGDYLNVIEKYANIKNSEELKEFFDQNKDKVNFIKIDDLTDVEPLLPNNVG